MLRGLGHVARAHRDRSTALPLYRRALDLSRALGDTRDIGLTLYYLGETELALGDPGAAGHFYGQALRPLLETGDAQFFAAALARVASLAADAGQHLRALRLAGAAAAAATPDAGLPTETRACLERVEAAGGRAVGREAAAAAWAQGRLAPPAQTLTDALEPATRATHPHAGGAPHSDVVPVWASAAARAGGLTPREWEVLGLLVAGASNRAIATRLGISPHTAVRHVLSIAGKLGAHSRGEAVARALGLGAESPDGNPARDAG